MLETRSTYEDPIKTRPLETSQLCTYWEVQEQCILAGEELLNSVKQ